MFQRVLLKILTYILNMKLKDIDIPTEVIMIWLYFLWFFVAVNVIGLTLTIIKAVSLICFDYKIIIFGIPL